MGQLSDMVLKDSVRFKNFEVEVVQAFSTLRPTVKPDDVSHCWCRSGCNVESAMFVLHRGGPPLARA